jgi:hypothetical protein
VGVPRTTAKGNAASGERSDPHQRRRNGDPLRRRREQAERRYDPQRADEECPDERQSRSNAMDAWPPGIAPGSGARWRRQGSVMRIEMIEHDVYSSL